MVNKIKIIDKKLKLWLSGYLGIWHDLDIDDVLDDIDIHYIGEYIADLIKRNKERQIN